MNILMMEDEKGGACRLSTESPQSHYGIPVLRIEAEDVNGDFGPADIVAGPPTLDGKPLLLAAQIVYGWASRTERTQEEIKSAKKFLGQWPEGPQI